MRGYLTPNRLDLTVRQNRQYFYSQCGLCQQLKEDFGSFTRFLVNRDALLLQLLVEALQENPPITQQIRCGVKPFLHPAHANPIAAKFASAVTILMVSGKLQDTIYDGNFVYALGSKVSLLINQRKIKQAEQALSELGFDAQQIYDLLIQQQQVENLPDVNLEKAAQPTGKGLGLLFAHIAVLVNRPELKDSLQKLGENLGRFIYVLDAREDLKTDIKNHQFNPLKPEYEKTQSVDLVIEHNNDWIEKQLTEINRCFQALNGSLFRHQEILENLFTLGLNKTKTITSKTKNNYILSAPLILLTQLGCSDDCCNSEKPDSFKGGKDNCCTNNCFTKSYDVCVELWKCTDSLHGCLRDDNGCIHCC